MMRFMFVMALFLTVAQVSWADCSKGNPIRQKLELIETVPIEYRCEEPNPNTGPSTIKTKLVTANLKDAKGNLFTAVMNLDEVERLKKEPDFAFLHLNCCVGLASTACDAKGNAKDKRIATDKLTAACLKERFFTFEFAK